MAFIPSSKNFAFFLVLNERDQCRFGNNQCHNCIQHFKTSYHRLQLVLSHCLMDDEQCYKYF